VRLLPAPRVAQDCRALLDAHRLLNDGSPPRLGHSTDAEPRYGRRKRRPDDWTDRRAVAIAALAACR